MLTRVTTHQIPLITLREGVIFPQTEAILAFGRESSIIGIGMAVKNKNLMRLIIN